LNIELKNVFSVLIVQIYLNKLFISDYRVPLFGGLLCLTGQLTGVYWEGYIWQSDSDRKLYPFHN